MPNLYVIYKNHLDLTWRRPRYHAGRRDGYAIIPYGELQERMLDRAFDYIREGGVYALEQTISLREYLERNPDVFDEVRDWIRDGRLVILGGGESVIDYNLPDGESVVRNHLYSRLWLRDTFGCTPKLANCPDTFGLSANLPNLFRQLGYRGLSEYHRVFEGAKPYWRGISGDVVTLASASFTMPRSGFGDCIKCRVCTVCGGEGCPACEGSGFYADVHPTDLGHIAALKQRLSDTEGDFCISFDGEESMAAEHVVPALRRLAEECGRTIVFTTSEALVCRMHRTLLDYVDNAPEEGIDSREEGNPTGSGCYTSRIKLKQAIRRCESALRTAEHLATAAALEGVPYPAKTFAYWWRKMAFLLFHDAAPASHSDEAYDELMEICRALCAAVARITEKSAKKLLDGVGVENGDGIPFAVFNPLEFPVENAHLCGTVRLSKWVTGGKVVFPDGTVRPVLAVHRTASAGYDCGYIEFLGSLPAFGYAICRFLPDEEELPAPKPVRRRHVMENDHLRVTFGDCELTEVYDKAKGCVIACEGTFAPWLADDAGHPWGRTNEIQYEERADMPTYCENMFPATVAETSMETENRVGVQITRLHVRYGREEKQIHSLDWTAEFLLADTSRELDVTIHTTFNARDIRLMTQVVLPEAPRDGKLIHEIPLGKIARGRVNAYNSQLGYADEWAALRYVSAPLSDCTVTLCNNGTPGHTVHRDCENAIAVSLLRTPTQMCCGFGFTQAIDITPHTFRFTLATDMSPTDAYRRGMTLNTEFPTVAVTPREGKRPMTERFLALPDDLPLLALKGAENGDGFIVRYLGDAEEKTLSFAVPVMPCSLLEDCTGVAVRAVDVKPYDIVTIRMSADALRG